MVRDLIDNILYLCGLYMKDLEYQQKIYEHNLQY